MEQLGHPVPGNVTGMPVESPVDKAVAAVKQVWDSREARGVLVGNLSRIEGFGREVANRAGNALSEEVAARVRELEERKSRLMGEVEELHRANMRPAEELPKPDADAGKALIARVKAYFAACGCPRSNDEIVMMLAAAAQRLSGSPRSRLPR